MALPEDDVEEVEPEEALARVLDHDHDALGDRAGAAAGPRDHRARSARSSRRPRIDGPTQPAGPPVLLDAEALRSLASIDEWWAGVRRRAVMTPHAGEFARLRTASGRDPAADGDLVEDDAARAAASADAARAWGQVVVLKGARTVIASPTGEIAVAPFENPALASGGTGDVLSGTIGSLLSQGLEPFAAARLGVYLHGLAGEAVRARIGDAGLLASDLIDELAVRTPPPRGDRRTALRPARRVRRATRRREGPRGTARGARGGGVTGATGDRDGIRRALRDAGLPALPRTAWLAVDLDRLRDNLVALRALVPAGTRVDPVVKADAYGHGAVPVARSLEAAGADGFGVATFDEALELRAGGVRGADPGPVPGAAGCRARGGRRAASR